MSHAITAEDDEFFRLSIYKDHECHLYTDDELDPLEVVQRASRALGIFVQKTTEIDLSEALAKFTDGFKYGYDFVKKNPETVTRESESQSKKVEEAKDAPSTKTTFPRGDYI